MWSDRDGDPAAAVARLRRIWERIMQLLGEMKWINGGNAMEIGELLRPREVARTFLILDAERKRWSGIPPPRLSAQS